MPSPTPVDYTATPLGAVAHRRSGDGPPVVLAIDWFSHLGEMWRPDSPMLPLLTRFTRFSTLITFDKRGVGLSDPLPPDRLPSMEEWIDDVRAVLDHLAVGSATIVGVGSGGPMAVTFAATHPDRVDRLVLVNAWARLSSAPDFPIGVPEEMQEALLEPVYMTPEAVAHLAGSDADFGTRRWYQDYVRTSASPSTTAGMRRWLFTVDVRPLLASVRCPTLVLSRSDAWVGSEHAEVLAEGISDAQLRLLDGNAAFMWVGDHEEFVAPIEEFVTGRPAALPAERVLATLLLTDIVQSTALAGSVGDRTWRTVLERHDTVCGQVLERHGGRQVKHTGDGILATFDRPAHAVQCALDLRERLRGLGIDIRAGLHAGEIEVRGDDVGGIAVHTAARIEALAEPGEVLASRTVRDLVAGSGLAFVDRGQHSLKGIDGDWQVFAAID